jgi:uncharacterized membrane protein
MKILTEQEETQILEAIRNAEEKTSGEIKLHIESECKSDAIERAIEVFGILKMNETEQRNGILFYVATDSKKFAIIGDEGINEKVPSNFWESTKELMRSYFIQHKFADGITKGIEMAGEQLQTFFPFNRTNDKNELSDDISFGK